MGVLLSRFRKKPSTKEQLENIEKELENIDDFRFYTQQTQKRMVGSLIIYSVTIYIVAAIVFYFYYFPSELSKQILYSLPLIVFPVIIWIIKQLLHWYYRYRLSQNDDQILILLRERKKLLKQVMEKETYKVAKELLEKYDPEHSQKKSELIFPVSPIAPDILSKMPETELRKRSSLPANMPLPQLSVRPLRPQTPPASFRPSVPIRPGYNAPPNSYPRIALPLRPSGIPMPCPILPQQRGVFDRMVEYVVGDGPNNRYALICRQCQSHNGMALREEFEFIAFKCCYCYAFNPARKQRPMAPRLVLPTELTSKTQEDDKTSSAEESGSEGTAATTPDDQTNEDVPINTNDANTVQLEALTTNGDTQLVKPSDDAVDGTTCDTETTDSVTVTESSGDATKVTPPSDEEMPKKYSDENLCSDDVSSIGVTNEELPVTQEPS